jgi:hypothetical protein
MKYTNAVALSFLAGAITASPLVASVYDKESAPFTLQVISNNESLNGKSIDACHSGAAQEILCLPTSKTSGHATFYVNYTSADSRFSQDLGVLTWHLVTGDRPEDIHPSTASFQVVDPAHNGMVAPYINVGPPRASPDFVYFGKNDKMYPIGNNPANIPDTRMPDRWAICNIKTVSTKDILTWQSGMGAAADPSCYFIGLRRVWVK